MRNLKKFLMDVHVAKPIYMMLEQTASFLVNGINRPSLTAIFFTFKMVLPKNSGNMRKAFLMAYVYLPE